MTLLACAAVAVGGLSSAARATDRYWNSAAGPYPAGGSFQASANWLTRSDNSHVVPGTADYAVFEAMRQDSYVRIYQTANVTNAGVISDGGDTRIGLDGHAWTVTNTFYYPLVVGINAEATARFEVYDNSQGTGTFRTSPRNGWGVLIGSAAGSNGTMVVGINSQWYNDAGYVDVGLDGAGTLLIGQNARFTNAADTDLGANAGGSGTISFQEGGYAELQNVYVGLRGAGTVQANANGSYLSTVNLTLGSEATASGLCDASMGTIGATHAIIGQDGVGQVIVRSTGSFYSNSLDVGLETGSSGTITVSNNGFAAGSGGAVNVGVSGNGALFQSGPGITIYRDLTLAQNGGTGSVTLTGGTSHLTNPTIIGVADAMPAVVTPYTFTVGLSGVGTFTQTGASIFATDDRTLIVGGNASNTYIAAGYGNYTLAGTSILDQASLAGFKGNAFVGDGGVGSMTVASGARHNVGVLTIGHFASTFSPIFGTSSAGVGTYTTSGTVNADSITVADGGVGTLQIRGGAVNVATTMTLANGGASVANLSIGLGTLSVQGGSMVVGNAGTATVTQTGGAVNVPNATSGSAAIIIGKSGRGTYALSGGSVSAPTVTLGLNATSQGSLLVSGGTANVGALKVGTGGAGLLWLTGGTVNASGVSIGTRGTVRIDGGTLNPSAGMPGALAIANDGTLEISSGSAVIGAITGNGTTSITPSTSIQVASISQSGLDVAGTLQLPAVASPSAVALGALTIEPTGRFDVTNRPMAINDPTITSRLKNYLLTGYNGGLQTGAGLVSSTALPTQGIGYAVASEIGSPATWFGVAISPTTVVTRLTLLGDANLDGAVGFNDLLTLAQNYGGATKVWTQGDVNYDGTVNFGDLLSLAQNYNRTFISTAEQATLDGSTTAGFAADWALARSLVPEPSLLGLLSCMIVTVRRRRSSK